MTEITFEELLERILKLAKIFEVLEEAESKVGNSEKPCLTVAQYQH